MKSINVDVFTFDELSDEVKAKMVEDNRYEFQGDAMYMDWEDMWRPTIEKFEEIFNVDLGINDRYGWGYRVSFNEEYFFDNGEVSDFPDCNGQYSIRMDELSGEKLRNYIDTIFSDCMKGKYYSTGGKFVDDNGKQEYRYKKRYSKIMKEWNNCPLTGCCSDIPILAPIAEYLNHKQGGYGWRKEDGTINKSWNHYTFQDLMEACAASIINEIEASSDYYLRDEYIMEELSNRYSETEFFEDGRVFTGRM